MYWSTTYAWLMVVMGVALIILIAILQRLEEIALPTTWKGASRVVAILKKHVVLPALYGGTHRRRKTFLGLTLTTPWRLQTIVAILFLGVNFAMMFASINVYNGNTKYKTRLAQWSVYTADRAGILALGQLPLLIVFAGRNHIFMWATGWSFQTFNRFHKLIACTLTAHCVVHAGLYTYIEYLKAPLHEFWEEEYVPWGIAGLTALIILTTGSIAIVRNLWYDAWLMSHIVFAAVSIVGMWKHVRLAHHGNGTQVWMPWIYAATALWIFDRLLRIARVVVYNYSTAIDKDALSSAVLLSDDVVKMRVPVSPLWKFYPGQYLFLYLPSHSYQQNHPFSVVDVDRSTPNPTATILFKGRKGMTKRTLDACLSHSSETGSPLQLRALVEGPYGTQPRLDHYDNVILVAGGIGITAMIPFLMYLAETPIRLTSRSVVLHWILRDTEHAHWFADEFARAIAAQSHKKNLLVKIVVHVSKNLASSASSTDGASSKEKHFAVVTTPVDLPEQVVVQQGRPVLSSLLAAELEEAVQGSHSVVVSCGPPTLGDDCRAAVIAGLTASAHVSYIEENFSW
ncbi:ferric reductase NAD binding domain-domain-containing protein [Protomyces lactucae-debilis]|uniref:ferric-chelate reductase (NADPH) n=1 Tax=Protomyces lactucae-debilis TaxID=2754530 RepID=A0A1Y2FIA4_PROLT|nr:ferric reductase NAD binding domain-containing protein [Protomyces lactucae-debilis]ORY83653.1 ferric reductase NAD binding domain-domain-containing protein [Protomyces lactucae-debilis]